MLENRLKRSLRTTLTGLVVNLVLVGSKLSAGILGHSHALVADAVESLADIFSSLIVWRGIVVAAEPADEDHPYGHGKAEPIAAAVVAAILLLAAAWITVTAIHEIQSPHQTPAPFTLAVLMGVIIVKETLFRYVITESEALSSSVVETDAWHHRSDALTSAAAAIGITIALIGGPAFASADDYAAIAAAAVILWNGWRMLRKALNELMDRAPGRDLVREIRGTAERTTGVECIEKCLVRKMGYQLYVDLHAQVDPQMTVRTAHEIAHQVKDRIRQAHPTVSDVLVHIEPMEPEHKPQPRAKDRAA